MQSVPKFSFCVIELYQELVSESVHYRSKLTEHIKFHKINLQYLSKMLILFREASVNLYIDSEKVTNQRIFPYFHIRRTSLI
jgi:hypothetical protein